VAFPALRAFAARATLPAIATVIAALTVRTIRTSLCLQELEQIDDQ
jgi:hypothetical protein